MDGIYNEKGTGKRFVPMAPSSSMKMMAPTTWPSWIFLLGQLEGVADKLGLVPDEHLDELRPGNPEEDGVGQVGACARY